LRQRGIRHRIARRGIKSSQRLGHHRWTMERPRPGSPATAGLHRRDERKAERFLAFTSPALTLIRYRRLAK